ncbi:MAG: SusC/RagA family TonB-linked outer membrane protein [Chitinophagales bacterium]|nr:SusC/RagA family TonB-linked outer membrane protein [Chitinophagales bacterium]
MKKNYLFTLLTMLLCLLTTAAFAQRTITGTVSDGNGEALIGATVQSVGGTGAATTDLDGKYSISVSKETTALLFSYVGFDNETVTLGTSNTIDVSLRDAGLLDEVVIMGIPRSAESAGYATQKLDGDGLIKAREPNLINAISGKIAGVQITSSSGSVGASSRLVVRGAASITGSTDPLYVVDGVPLDNRNLGTAGDGSAVDGGGFDLPNGIADINPDDIKDITVLKGPNAAALYGIRAANGVVLITTKSGKAGQKGFGVSFNSSTTFETPLVLPDFQNSYGQGPDPNYFYWENGSTDDGGVDESWGPPLDAGLSFTQWESFIDPTSPDYGKPLPWVSHPNNIRDFYDTGITSNNNISFNGGAKGVGYRLSLGLMNQKGMVPNTEYKRYNVGANTNFDISSRLKAGVSANYAKATSGNLPTVGYDSENPVQQMIWSGRNVDFNKLRDWENLPLAPAGTAAEGTPLNWNTVFQNNPYWVLANNLNKYNKDRLFGNVNLAYRITDDLSITAKTGADTWSSLASEQKAVGSNEYQEGYYTEIARTFMETNSDVLLSYKKQLSPDFDFSINLGGNMMKSKTRLLVGTAAQLELPGVYNLGNVKSGTSPSLTNVIRNWAINSIYGTGQIAFKDALYLDFTGRNDWSSLLPLENNSFFYPSVTLSAVLSDLWTMPSGIDYLKVRGGWAKVGSTGALAAYETAQTFDFRADPFGTVLLPFNPAQLNNPNIGPEFTTGTEYGIEAKFFDRRLRFDFTYYDQTSKDLIVPVEVSASSGYITSLDNVGIMNNKGIELQLGLTAVKTQDFSLDFTFNFAKNNNIVESLGGLTALNLGGQWNVNLQAREDMPYGVLFGPGYLRDDSGEIIHVNGIPQRDPTNKVLGNIQPDFTGGVGVDLAYKGFSINGLVDFRKGSDIYSMTSTWGRYSGVLQETIFGRETGIVGTGVKNIGTATEPNYVTNDVVVGAETYNKAAYSNAVAEGSVFDASFVKLRQLMLTYQLPNNWFGKSVFQGASISLVGRNLAILHRNAPHIDPETGFSSQNAEQGQEFGQLPSARSIGFNLNFNF